MLYTNSVSIDSVMENIVIKPAFTLELYCKITSGLVTVGRYDGIHSYLTAVTTGDKVLIHCPHKRLIVTPGRVVQSDFNREIATLNIGEAITALTPGKLLPNEDKEMLVIGTLSHLLVYHIHDNRDILYRECKDGINAVTIGTFKAIPMVFVGGYSSIRGYDYKGCELFWTTTGDVVSSLVLLDFDKDGNNELMYGSKDYHICVHNAERIIFESIETEVVTGLLGLPDRKFAYCVSNGTVGVYEHDMRLWRVKSKNAIVSIYNYDLLGEGIPQLITGWSNGKIDCRTIFSGEVLFKDTMPHSLAGIIEADYRMTGKSDLICVSVNGEVRGYAPARSINHINENESNQEVLRNLLSKKRALSLEVNHYENNANFNCQSTKFHYNVGTPGVIPANTKIQVTVSTNSRTAKPGVEILLSTNNFTIIKATIVFAEGIFKGETLVVHPSISSLSSCICIFLYPPKNTPIDIHMKVLVGQHSSLQYHVFELIKELPRFTMFTLIKESVRNPESGVEFKINERLQRLCMWFNQNFLLEKDIEYVVGSLIIHLENIRDASILVIRFDMNGEAFIFTSDILLAAEIVQSLRVFLNLTELQTTACFKEEEKKLQFLLNMFTEIQESKLKLNSDVADKLNSIRNLIVLAEDRRINKIMNTTWCYHELNMLNQEIINAYNIKLNNFHRSVDSVKIINSIIQTASKLRVGLKEATILRCSRSAMKENNLDLLLKIIRTGQI